MKLELLISEEEIRKKVKELAEQINRDYKDKKPILIGVLKGAFIFMADLIRELKIPVKVEFVRLKSYAGTETTGKVEVKLDIEENVKGKDVIVVEDIIDSGITIDFLTKKLIEKGVKSVAICALLDKPERRVVNVRVDYVGFKIPNKFVVGYGLDFNEKYRELPAIYVVQT